jgi:hypothetical protein
MATHGFLLFKYSVHKGQTHKPVILDSLDKQHFFDLIDTDLRKLKVDGTLAGKPQSQQPDLDSDAVEGSKRLITRKRYLRLSRSALLATLSGLPFGTVAKGHTMLPYQLLALPTSI